MMQSNPSEMREFSPIEAFEGALDWWREAGVDCAFADQPHSWLAVPETDEAVAAPSTPIPSEPIRTSALQRALSPGTGDPFPTELPDSLEKFREWWLSEPSLAPGSLDRRVPPSGAAGAKLMVLVEQPAGEGADGLLSPEAEKLVAAITRAMAIERHETYRASALPVPMPLPDWNDLAARGMGTVLRHHIALAAPRRVLAFGRGQLTLFDFAAQDVRAPLSLDCDGTAFPLLAAPGLAQIAQSAARRQRLWQRWLDWTE